MSLRNILSKFSFAGAAQLNSAGNAALDFDPTAILNLDTDNAAEALRQTQPKMERFAAKVQELKERVASEDEDLKELSGMIDQNLVDEAAARNSGDTAKADSIAADAATLQSQLDEKTKTHNDTVVAYSQLQSQYDATEKQIRSQVDAITAKRNSNASLADKLEESQIVKAATDLRTSLASHPQNFSDRAEKKVQDLIHQNLSSVEVAGLYDGTSQVDSTALALQRSKQRAAATSADTALAERRKKLGLT